MGWAEHGGRLSAGCFRVSDESVVPVAEHCTRLRTLGLRRCAGVGDRGVTAVADSCHQLEALFLCGTGVTDTALYALADSRLTRLTRLYLSECAVGDAGVMALVKARPGLVEDLDLQGCAGGSGGISTEGIFSVAYNCPGLRSLDYSDCDGVDSSRARRVVKEQCPVVELEDDEGDDFY